MINTEQKSNEVHIWHAIWKGTCTSV